MTMKLIETATVGTGGAGNIQFLNIPSTYTDLFIVTSLRCTGNSYNRDDIVITFNNSNANQYSGRMLYGNDNGNVGTTNATSGTQLDNMMRMPSSEATANTFGSTSIYISNYASSANKTISMDSVIENNSSAGYFNNVSVGMWANSSAITSIKLSGATTSLVQYSTASLYGITKGSGGATVSTT